MTHDQIHTLNELRMVFEVLIFQPMDQLQIATPSRPSVGNQEVLNILHKLHHISNEL